MQTWRIGLVGYGEVGRIFCAALRPAVAWTGAWDLRFEDPAQHADALRPATASDVTLCTDLPELCARSNLVISAVTASNTLAVAQAAAGHVSPGTLFLDLNSASPGTKQAAAEAIESAGAHYVEAGVMTSVPPHGIAVPMLLGGPHAARVAPELARLGLNVRVASERLGVASATKMCRSVMIKGLEALVLESYTAARHHGVEDAMLETLQETFPGIDWQTQGSYFFSRVAQHGRRRAEEMREAARTVRETGIDGVMADAIADQHAWMADRAQAGAFDGLPARPRWQDFADALIAQTPARPPGAH